MFFRIQDWQYHHARSHIPTCTHLKDILILSKKIRMNRPNVQNRLSRKCFYMHKGESFRLASTWIWKISRFSTVFTYNQLGQMYPKKRLVATLLSDKVFNILNNPEISTSTHHYKIKSQRPYLNVVMDHYEILSLQRRATALTNLHYRATFLASYLMPLLLE